jgi:hypothetical protein
MDAWLGTLLALESCHSTWVFDGRHMRFKRILKGLAKDTLHVTTEWRPYSRLELDDSSESFIVWLNPEGTRLLRSWRHVEHCSQCGGDRTGEHSLDEIRSAEFG